METIVITSNNKSKSSTNISSQTKILCQRNIIRLQENRDQMLRSGECTASDIEAINNDIKEQIYALQALEKSNNYNCIRAWK